MDITRFNKELANKIAQAKRYEKSNEIKSAIKIWLEISEMTINLSKSRNINISFKNMLITRTKQIFEHIKNLKSGYFEEELLESKYSSQKGISAIEPSFEYDFDEDETNQEQDVTENADSRDISTNKIIENSEYKNMPKGFKELKTSEDFKIITPHDEDFLKKQLDKAFESEYFRARNRETNDTPKVKRTLETDQPREGKYKTCFACGYDKNLAKDKICKNCGTILD
ncbi:MAG: hypothetical protein ACFFEY_01025 [Candidatus Thorarchaeota archaeon]